MDTQIAKGKVRPLRINLQAIGKGWDARGRHAPARDPSGECDGAHPIRKGLVDGFQGRAKSPFGHGVSGSWNAP